MADSEALAKLHDIHLPKSIGWWPLAPGWYVVSLSILILLFLLAYLSYRSYSNGKAKRQALQILRLYEEEYLLEPNSQLSSMKVSELLRRVALVYYPREEVASLQGEAWIAFLISSSKGIDFNALSDYLLALPYQPAREINLQPLFSKARLWIKQRGRPCLN